jgi:hypothetical protein
MMVPLHFLGQQDIGNALWSDFLSQWGWMFASY